MRPDQKVLRLDLWNWDTVLTGLGN